MPHVIVEHSANIADHYETKQLLSDIHNALADAGAPIERVKTRSIALNNFIIGTDAPDAAMIHITVLLLAGRDVATQKAMCDPVHEMLVSKVATIDGLQNCSVTMEIRDMAADTYYK